MGWFKKLNSTARDIKNKKERLKTLTDKSQRDEDDIKCIRKSKIWSTINIILLVPLGFIFYYCATIILSELFLGGIMGIVISLALYATSVTKCRKYTSDEAPSLMAVILSYIPYGGIFVVLGVLFLILFVL